MADERSPVQPRAGDPPDLLGEILLALFRGLHYACGFMVITTLLGLNLSWTALLAVPAALIVAFGFAAVGLTATSYMKGFQHFDLVYFIMLPMSLLSATFFPIEVYPTAIQWVIMAMPLWHGVDVNGVHSVSEAVDILLLGVSLAVAAVPEGLPAILSLVLAFGVQMLAGRNAVMKDLHSVETLGAVSVICSDKTGTLTKNEMTLREVVTASGRVKLSGTGYEPTGEVRLLANNDDDVVQRVIGAGVLANNAQLGQVDGVWQIQGDPTEAAFLVAERKLEGLSERVSGYQREGEAPFDSERKLMSVLGRNRELGVTRVFSKGAPDVLLERCVAQQVGGETRPLTDGRRDEIARSIVELSEEGFRTLGVAWREADETPETFDEAAERDLVWTGFVGIIDPPREEAAFAIREAHRAGIRTVMITGDHPVTASKIASDLGIVEGEGRPTAVTGRDLDALDEAGWRRRSQPTSVYARVSPEHKLKIVDALQAQQQIVSMTGDGVNDAPALKSADIGIAMGITGTEVTKEAAEMILGDDNYSTIVAAVRQGRVIYDNIKKFIRYLLSSNMGEVATVFLGVVLGGVIELADPGNPGATVVPLLATQILWINLVTDSGPALAMGVDPEIDDVMAGGHAATTTGSSTPHVVADHRRRSRHGHRQPRDLRSVAAWWPAERARTPRPGRRGVRRRTDHRLHGAGVHAAVQRFELAGRHCECLRPSVHQQVAVAVLRRRDRRPDPRGRGTVPAGRVRHGLARPAALGGRGRRGCGGAGLRGDRQGHPSLARRALSLTTRWDPACLDARRLAPSVRRTGRGSTCLRR
ncbi:hypothetical protein BW733_05095 [Tessaracoccus flavescens]|uniref:Cation-transporting P-type ATPase C-terminal domain-containing protein n=1 Tax=Tessaracoccus flavescens TaxID=399497 RepID=A0A1Q2CW10_9ACTN|nr:hypothetical protein BW733_05095 [Tessaracoccus flavescens]